MIHKFGFLDWGVQSVFMKAAAVLQRLVADAECAADLAANLSTSRLLEGIAQILARSIGVRSTYITKLESKSPNSKQKAL